MRLELGSGRSKLNLLGLIWGLKDLIWGSEGPEQGFERPDLWFDHLRGQSWV